jgi:hypothetical protein
VALDERQADQRFDFGNSPADCGRRDEFALGGTRDIFSWQTATNKRREIKSSFLIKFSIVTFAECPKDSFDCRSPAGKRALARPSP